MSLLSRALNNKHGNCLSTLPNHDNTAHQSASRSLQHSLSSKLRSTNEDFPETRPSKRRKFEIRGPRQQTLDSFFNSIPLRPPAKIAQLQTHGSTAEKLNGVPNEPMTTNGHALPHDSPNVTQLDGTSDAPRNKLAKKSRASVQAKPEERRSLRSQDDGPRLKSELATYFQNYEDIILDTQQASELLDVDSSLYITDDASAGRSVAAVISSPSKSPKSMKDGPATIGKTPASPTSVRATEIDLSIIMRTVPEDAKDPMSDDAFLASHRRAERKEKQMRNIEREHAMHEKVQLDRLLDGLLGHDWLRVLGVTGITDGEAKKYEVKRDYFIAEVQALIAKFNAWKDEEKRQRMSREAALMAEREEEADDAEDDDDDDDAATSTSSGDPPSSDLNHSASRQLQEEAAAARSRKRKEQRGQEAPPVLYRPPSPIKSFYSSRHLRETALKKPRNSRNQTAFGLLLPELDEREFALPVDYVTEDVLKASARERRRRRREHVSSSAGR